jgi:phosphatidylinositol alpha-mannosyltransferase
VCIVVPYDVAEEGGVKRHAFHVAEALRKSGDQVTVVGPLSRGDAGPGFQGFRGVVNIPANGAANHMAIFTPPWAVRRFFRTANFDVVHIHEPLVPLLPYYALLLSAPAAHVCTFHMYAESEPPSARTVRRILGSWMFPRFDGAIAVSQPAAEYAGRVWTRPLAVIPNGVPTRTFLPPEPDDAAVAPDRPLRLLFVGHWRDPRKGLPHLLQAYRALRAEGLPVRLDVVGAGTPTAEKQPDVTFHGPVASEAALAGHYRNCDVFVAPATGQESFGIVLLEAMACARPLVCSDIPGYRQVVDAAGGRFVAPGDVAGLARAITDLARDPELRRRMGEANRSRAAAFDWDGIVGRVREQYVAALAERRNARALVTPLQVEA